MAVTHDTLERLAQDPTPANQRAARKLLESRRSKHGYGQDEIDAFKSEFPALFPVKASGAGGMRWDPRRQWRALSPNARRGVKYAAGGLAAVVVVGLVARALRSSTPATSSGPAAAGATLVVMTPGGAAQPGVLRAAAGPKAPRLELIPAGTPVQVLGSTTLAGGAVWMHVQPPAPHRAGWMHTAILGAPS